MRADDAKGAVAELAASQHGAYTRRQAARLGISTYVVAGMLRRGEIEEPLPGVLRVTSSPLTFRARLSVATLAASGTVASHRSAALLHGMDAFATAPLEVTVKRGRAPDLDGVILHRSLRLDGRDATVVDGIKTTSVERTLCDLGAVVHQDLVEQCVDWALRRGMTEQQLRAVLDRVDRPGPSGTPTLRRVLDDPRRQGQVPQTWFERLVQRIVTAADLPPFELQYTLRAPGGAHVATFDGAFVAWRLALEAHSAEWHDRKARVWRDLERDNRVKALGWDVVYVTWAMAQQPPGATVDLIRRIQAHRSAS